MNVANFRREDHLNLLRAFRLVLRKVPEAHLILLGGANQADYHAEVIREAATNGLRGHVTWLDSRPDVPAILKACDIGVLASMSEGLPALADRIWHGKSGCGGDGYRAVLGSP